MKPPNVIALGLLLLAISCLDFTFAFVPKQQHNVNNNRRVVAFRSSSSTKVSAISSSSSSQTSSTSSDAFLTDTFNSFQPTSCDNINTPPSLSILLRSISALKSGSDIRGQYVDHNSVGSIANVAHAITSRPKGAATAAALTPFAAYCYGHAFGRMVKEEEKVMLINSGTKKKKNDDDDDEEAAVTTTICIGRDPREHGIRLSDAIARGAESVMGVKVLYTGLATTPSMFEFCRADKCDGAIMVTASHLPPDRNGMKLFTKHRGGGFTKRDIHLLCDYAMEYARDLHDFGIMPPASGIGAVFCSDWVDFMPHYASTLRSAILREVNQNLTPAEAMTTHPLPLAGLRIVLNTGNGSGSFFHSILSDLGADVSASLHITPDHTFPNGIPNPENNDMVYDTTQACERSHADLGIMLDTDADRCGFVVPRTVTPEGSSNYEPLNRNRLIALLSVIFQQTSPGCTIVTDSVTSEGLTKFLTKNLGLNHVRYLRGYANVIGKAKQLTSSGKVNAEMAIETSGHCAMRENGYLDDGTYTAVKVIGLLARFHNNEANGGNRRSLLDLIQELDECEEVSELRLNINDGTIDTTSIIFDHAALLIEEACGALEGREHNWVLDRDNLEGIRVRIGNTGGFFMLRKSLHDPLISFQVESTSKEHVRKDVIMPLVKLFKAEERIREGMDLSLMEEY